jgi:hypothetical protein
MHSRRVATAVSCSCHFVIPSSAGCWSCRWCDFFLGRHRWQAAVCTAAAELRIAIATGRTQRHAASSAGAMVLHGNAMDITGMTVHLPAKVQGPRDGWCAAAASFTLMSRCWQSAWHNQSSSAPMIDRAFCKPMQASGLINANVACTRGVPLALPV